MVTAKSRNFRHVRPLQCTAAFCRPIFFVVLVAAALTILANLAFPFILQALPASALRLLLSSAQTAWLATYAALACYGIYQGAHDFHREWKRP